MLGPSRHLLRAVAHSWRCQSLRSLSSVPNRNSLFSQHTQWNTATTTSTSSAVARAHRRSVHQTTHPLGKVIPFLLPDVGEGIATVIVKEWLVKPGDKVNIGDEVCEVQSDKSAATIHCPFEGVVKELMYEVEDVAKKDHPFLMIEVEEDESGASEAQAAPEPETSPEPVLDAGGSRASKVLATPAVRRLAAERGIMLSDVKGTGKAGRVLKEDILRLIDMPTDTRPAAVAESVVPPPPLLPPDVRTFPPHAPVLEEDKTEPVRGFKLIMAKTMTASGQVPQFGYCDEVDMSNLVELRKDLRSAITDKGIRFSYMPIMLKALSLSLHQFPILNGHVDSSCSSITYKADHNIGIAMDTPQGLVVPNIKQVQNKSVFEVTMELNRIHNLGLQGNLSPSDVTGGTFSLSNIGAIGGTYSRPLVLPPEVCIGAFGKLRVVPRFTESDELRKAHVMCVSWSADHRVIDGATVARFSNLWKSYLENPALMMIDLK